MGREQSTGGGVAIAEKVEILNSGKTPIIVGTCGKHPKLDLLFASLQQFIVDIVLEFTRSLHCFIIRILLLFISLDFYHPYSTFIHTTSLSLTPLYYYLDQLTPVVTSTLCPGRSANALSEEDSLDCCVDWIMARARNNNNISTIFDKPMHCPEEALDPAIHHEPSQTETGALLSNDNHIVDDAMDDDYVPPVSSPVSHIERLEHMRQLRLDQLDRHEDEQKGLIEQAMIEARVARLQGRRERRAAKQAMSAAMFGLDLHQDSQQPQGGSASNAEVIDADQTQQPRRRRIKRQRRTENPADQETRRLRAESREAATGANGARMPPARDTRMHVDVSESMQELSVLPASTTPDMAPNHMESQEETSIRPRKAKSTKHNQRDPQQLVESIAITLLSRMQMTVAKLVAGGLSSEEAQQTAIANEYKRAENIRSKRQIKAAKIEDPIARQHMQARHARSYEHAQLARRMVLEPGFLAPEEAAAFHERVESKLLKNNRKNIDKARKKLGVTPAPCDGLRARNANYSSTIGILQRNLENTRNTFGTLSDQYLNFKFMVEETIKELEAKLAMASQAAVGQQHSRVRLPADEDLYHDTIPFVIADRSVKPAQSATGIEHPTTVLQDAHSIPSNDDDDSSSNDDHDDYDYDRNGGGVELGMDAVADADELSGIGLRDDGIVSAAQARAEDETHLQALRALLSEMALHGQA